MFTSYNLPRLCSTTGYGVVHAVDPVSRLIGQCTLPPTLVLVTSVIAFPSASFSVKR